MKTKISGKGYTFILADCIDALELVSSDAVDVVITSPPYNLGISYSTYKDTRSADDYIQWCLNWGRQLSRVLKEDGSFFLNIGASPSQPALPHKIALLFEEIFNLQNTFHWIKSISIERPGSDTISVGHFKPINSYRYVNDCHEYVFHFTKSGKVALDRLALGVPYQDKSNIKRWAHTEGRDKRCRGNNWFIPYKTIQNKNKERPHPATFPIQLAENCLRLHGLDKNLLVLDPFVGLGNAAHATANLGIENFVGIDLDEAYLETAAKSLQSNPSFNKKLIKGHLSKTSFIPIDTIG
ncbi:MAG: site-specific DNA-methyltransferase [Verrucomicrobiota bacterium]